MEYETDRYHIECIDGIEGIKKLKDKSVKLMYGSPPYPNAKRDYCIWSTEEYLGKLIPFIKAV
jgi:DNA modification methylase